MNIPVPPKQSDPKERAAFGERIAPASLVTLWDHLKEIVPPQPRVSSVPNLWRYEELRRLIMEAGAIVSAEEADRRVLVLENPGLKGRKSITETLFAGFQLVLPGEIAPAHRHTASAIRFILEGHGGYTSVEGEKCFMEPGDFIITPGWTWHDHGNETDAPVIWLDGLDLALMQSLGPHFSEGYGEKRFPEGPPPGDSEARWGKMLRPVNAERGAGLNSPVMRYPYAETREALEQLSKSGDWDPYMGLKMEYTDPTTGGPAMPTMSTFIQLMPAGFKTERYRTTEAAVYTAIEGSGKVTVWQTTGTGMGTGAGEAMTMEWGPRDIFVIPCWHPHLFEVDDGADAVLFSFSDKVVQQKLGIWKDQRGNA